MILHYHNVSSYIVCSVYPGIYESLHLLDRLFSQGRDYDNMVLSDLAKGGLQSGVWIDEYNWQNKDKKLHYEKY